MRVVGFIKHLVVLFVIKHTDCWVKKPHPTHLCIAAVLKQLCWHLSTLFMSNCAICHWCCICQRKSENDWQGSRASLSSFSTFQMFFFFKKVGSTLRKAYLRLGWGWGGWKHAKGAGGVPFQFLQKLCLQETLSSWLVQITLHFQLLPFNGAICFKAHLLGALLWLIIKCVCSWRVGGGGLKSQKKSVSKNESRKQKQTSSHYHS